MNKNRTNTANPPGGDHETTPLLANGLMPSDNHHYKHSAAYDFFLNKNSTPGTDSPQPWVKAPANVWHILKVTLLSSKSRHRRLHFVQQLTHCG